MRKLPQMPSVTKLYIETTEEHGHLLRCMTRLLQAMPNVQDLTLSAYQEESMDFDQLCIHAGRTQTPVHLSSLQTFTKVGFEIAVSNKNKKAKGKNRNRRNRHNNDDFDESDDDVSSFGSSDDSFARGDYSEDHLETLLTAGSFRNVTTLEIDSTNFFKTCPAIARNLAHNVRHVTLSLPEVPYEVCETVERLSVLTKLRTIDARAGLEFGEYESLNDFIEAVPASVERLKISLKRKQLLESWKEDPITPQSWSGKQLKQVDCYPHRDFGGIIDETEDAADLERVKQIVDKLKSQGLVFKFLSIDE